ncbi:hypothetical protein J6590_013311 [Homalodisca vitripennis]|nr:hypothetical protein J6590_013311 [Homalodisca vitripennis]
MPYKRIKNTEYLSLRGLFRESRGRDKERLNGDGSVTTVPAWNRFLQSHPAHDTLRPPDKTGQYKSIRA